MKTALCSIEDTTPALPRLTLAQIYHVLSLVTDGPGDCITSTIAAKTPGGPQFIWFEGDTRYQMYHWRVYAYLTAGWVPKRYTVRRRCNNVRCVNPDHRS